MKIILFIIKILIFYILFQNWIIIIIDNRWWNRKNSVKSNKII